MDKNELFTALAKVQAEMKPTPKNKKNPFFKAPYADLAGVHDSSRHLLAKNGLCIIQTIDKSEHGGLELVTTLGHTSGQFIESCMPIVPDKSGPQALGSTLTYLRRYCEMAIIGQSAEEEDDDAEAAHGRTPQKPIISFKPATQFPKPEPKAQPMTANAGPTEKRLRMEDIPPEDIPPEWLDEIPFEPAPKDGIPPVPGPTEKQLKRLFAISKKANWTESDIRFQMKLMTRKESTKLLTWNEYADLTDHIEKHPKMPEPPGAA